MSELVFEDELYDMTSSVRPWLCEYFNAVYVEEEFSFSVYRTDLVFVQASFSILRRRYEKFGHLIPMDKRNRRRTYLWFVDNGPVTKDEFMREGPYSESYKWSIVNWLEERGYVESFERCDRNEEEWGSLSPQGAVVYDAVPIPFHSTIYAVELKQTDWEYAVEQANRAFQYADFWYVCMDASGVPSKGEAVDYFEEHGVGLLAADSNEIWDVEWAAAAEHRTGEYDRYYDGDIRLIGRNERWELNEKSLSAIEDL